MKEMLTYLVRSLVTHPEEVVVTEKKGEEDVYVFSLRVHPDDMGRVIGRNGRTARALRQMMSAKGALSNVKTQVDIEENGEEQ